MAPTTPVGAQEVTQVDGHATTATDDTTRTVDRWIRLGLGAILFGVAIWRSRVLPKGAGLTYALAGPLIALFGLFIGAAQTVGSALLIGAGVWMASHVRLRQR